jgi:two-component system sensor histidine kinase UhpB
MGFTRLPLLWRIFAVNALLLVLATVLLVVTPVTIHASIALVEAVVLAAGLGVMLAANLLLLRAVLAPLDRLIRRMQTVDLLRPGQRLVGGGGPEADELVRSFNEMLERLETERQESSRRAVAAQEAERLRIAHGLHDEVGQVLTGVLLELDALADADDDRRREAVAETKERVRRTLEEVRRIAQELRPAMLEHLGLVSALTELSSTFAARTGVAVEPRFDADLPPLSDEAEIAVYRVAQESLTNVARHAGATHVELSLERGARSVVLRVADDGRGFDEAAAAENGHGGLRGMRERAMLLGGAFAVTRRRRGGVEIRLELPAGAR